MIDHITGDIASDLRNFLEPLLDDLNTKPRCIGCDFEDMADDFDRAGFFGFRFGDEPVNLGWFHNSQRTENA